ncbi:MAG: TPM domain-containing protein [Anaerovibrio sp.]|uniref:TPM domain-containing protein n=1 Tax=Anaerovibrio sp. TaxID=1872532 RepID=UPI0025FE411D|nr:TPM domain-containing protein [Anaerovibrio sp.]MCR5175549.1 TPM domain-containing protein [Anaerovibrio sp.]
MKKNFMIFMSLLMLVVFSLPVMMQADAAGKTYDYSTGTVQGEQNRVDKKKLPADTGDLSLHDFAQVINDRQESKSLLEKLNRIEHSHGVRVAIMTVSSLGGKDINAFADDTLNKYYRDEANNNGSIIMVVCPSERKWAISTDNNMRERITDEHGYPAVKNSFIDHLSGNNYTGAFNDYAEKVDELLTYYENEGEPWDPNNKFSYAGFILGILASVGIGYLFVKHLRGKMSNVHHVDEADDYLDRNSIDITYQEDIFLHTTRTVTKRSNDDDDSSSGSSSSNGGGSGSY